MNSLLILTTVVSLGLAAVMSTVAWRIVRREQRRSDARISGLAAEIGDEDVAPPRPSVTRFQDSTTMFSIDRQATGRSTIPIAVGAGVLIIGTVILLAVVSMDSQDSQGSQGSIGSLGSAGSGETGVTNRVAAPIELVALGHERTADRLTVHGLVRNPTDGIDLTHLTAVVLLFDRAGALVTTERATVEASDLMPGAEAPFTVSVSSAIDVGRYRVSFRAGDDHIVPHVDKRDGA